MERHTNQASPNLVTRGSSAVHTALLTLLLAVGFSAQEASAQLTPVVNQVQVDWITPEGGVGTPGSTSFIKYATASQDLAVTLTNIYDLESLIVTGGPSLSLGDNGRSFGIEGGVESHYPHLRGGASIVYYNAESPFQIVVLASRGVRPVAESGRYSVECQYSFPQEELKAFSLSGIAERYLGIGMNGQVQLSQTVTLGAGTFYDPEFKHLNFQLLAGFNLANM